jgi:hypothetical protein
MAQRRAKAATDKDQEIAHRSSSTIGRVSGTQLVPQARFRCKDREDIAPMKKGGSHTATARCV